MIVFDVVNGCYSYMTSFEWSQAKILVTSNFPWVRGRTRFFGMFTEIACLKYPAGPSLTGATVM